VDLSMQDQPHRIGTEWRVLLVTEGGGAATATPWEIDGVTANTPANLQAALQALYDTNPGYFWGGPRMDIMDDGLSGKQPIFAVALLYNQTDDANITANYALR
jgi:hypothetical protein